MSDSADQVSVENVKSVLRDLNPYMLATRLDEEESATYWKGELVPKVIDRLKKESEGGDTLSSQDADRNSANRSSQNNAMTKLYLYRCPACGDLSARKSKDKVNICFDHRSSKDMNYVGELKLGDSRADGE